MPVPQLITEDQGATADEGHEAEAVLGTVAGEGQDTEDIHIVIQNLIQKVHRGIQDHLRDNPSQEDDLDQWKNRHLARHRSSLDQSLDLVRDVRRGPAQSLPVKDTPILLPRKK